MRGERFEQALGDVLLRHQVDLQVERFDGGASGGSDGADAGAQCAQVGVPGVEALDEKAHAVGAGEDQPVVRFAGRRWRGRAGGIRPRGRISIVGSSIRRAPEREPRRERARLLAGARHDDALAEQRQALVPVELFAQRTTSPTMMVAGGFIRALDAVAGSVASVPASVS